MVWVQIGDSRCSHNNQFSWVLGLPGFQLNDGSDQSTTTSDRGVQSTKRSGITSVK